MAPKKQKADDNFFQKVYKVARKVPRGRVTSYGAIAEYLGTKGSARMVGWAMNAAGSQFPPVPAQRVVNRNGMLTGKHHFAYPEQMQELLEAEGVEVVHDKVKNFNEIFWNPRTELPKSFSV
jgi:methylated-DNA-protein-cysteine methyltransferase-like protein